MLQRRQRKRPRPRKFDPALELGYNSVTSRYTVRARSVHKPLSYWIHCFGSRRAIGTMSVRRSAMATVTSEEALKQKQSDLKTKQDSIASLNKDAASLQSEIKALTTKVTEIQQSLAGYDKASSA